MALAVLGVGLLFAAAARVIEAMSLFELVLVLLGVAVALAALAILAGTWAAYGLPPAFAAATGNILRARQEAQTRQTRTLLRILIGSATSAIVVIGAAIALTWVNTASPPASRLLVIGEDAELACGTLANKADPSGSPAGLIVVETASGRVSIPRDDVRAMAAVGSC
jgi:hypothetical protein